MIIIYICLNGGDWKENNCDGFFAIQWDLDVNELSNEAAQSREQ